MLCTSGVLGDDLAVERVDILAAGDAAPREHGGKSGYSGEEYHDASMGGRVSARVTKCTFSGEVSNLCWSCVWNNSNTSEVR